MVKSVLDLILSMDDEVYSYKQNSKYAKCAEKSLKSYSDLLDNLNEEQAEAFKKFVDLNTDCTAVSNEEYFKSGVKVGFRFAVECLCE